MRKIWAIIVKEITSYFVSPVAYVALTVYLTLSGYFFFNQVCYIQEASLRVLFGNMSITFLFIMPLLTMRLLAEERRTNTIELLLTAPVTDLEIVLGKYLAGLFIVLLMLAATLIYPVCLTIYSEPDWGPIWGGYAGLLLLGASFLAVGIMASTFTKNPIVAALISFCLLLLYWTFSWIGEQMPPIYQSLMVNLSLSSHLADFLKGIIDTRHVIYYLSFIFFHLLVCFLSLESQRWRE